MARQQFYTEPWRKEFQLFNNFAGGLLSSVSDDNMTDADLSDVSNVSFDERGAISRRTGHKLYKAVTTVDKQAQGFHRHYKSVNDYVDMIFIGGKVEINGVIQEGITFQSERMVEAVQWGQRTYIATGSGLYQYKDGEGFKKVEPKKPDPLEALYIGTNALADDPSKFLDDGLGSHLQLTGVTFSSRYGTINNPFTLTAYVIKVSASDELEFQFEYRFPFMEDGAYHMGQDWSASKTWTHTPEGEGDMQFRIRVRKKGTTISNVIYDVPKYQVKPAPDPEDIEPDYKGIHTCNRIILHWERLVLYGDTINFDTIYISHLKAGNYFPMTNTLQFETASKEPVNAIVRFRDHLVAFTDTTIQALFGKSPRDYNRRVLNTAVGCIAPRGATVFDNYIAFVSLDGIYYLKSIGYVDDKANVSRLDSRISNLVPKGSRNAVLGTYRGEVHCTFPDIETRFRFYKDAGVWTKDESIVFNTVETKVYNTELLTQRENGELVVADGTLYTDLGTIYPARFVTKYMSFGMPHHPKKLKELQVTAQAEDKGVVALIKVYLDGFNKTNDVIEWKAKLTDTGNYNTFDDKLKISGRCLRIRLDVVHDLDAPFTFLDFGIIHKTKKP